MLYAFFGNDTKAVREKAHAFLRPFGERGMNVEAISAENYLPGILTEAAEGVSLFGGLRVVLIDTPSEADDFFEDVFASLAVLASAPTIFVLIEGALLAGNKRELTTHAKEVIEVSGAKKERFNAFSLTDALVRRDKKSLWMLLMKARSEGLSDEELIGTLFWQLKMLRLAAKARSAKEADLKPFVYEKARRALQKFTGEEVDALSERLVTLYHEGHSGVRDIDTALEGWVLSI